MKKYLWIFAGVAGIAGCLYLMNTHAQKKALNFFEQAQAAYSEHNSKEVVSLLESISFKRLDPQARLSARVYLAESYQAASNKEKARTAWNKVLELENVSVQIRDRAKFELALLDKERSPEKALTEFQQLAGESQNPHVAAGSLLQIAKEEENAGNLLEASQKYQTIINQYADSAYADEAIKRHGQIGVKLLFSKKQTPISKIHVVRPGESIALIAKKYNMPVDLLMESNNLTSSNIHPNDRLKVLNADFSIQINKSKNILVLKANDQVFKVYPVGTGKEGSTPIGEFKITSKLAEPTWYHPDGGVIPYGEEGNLLGTRWMGINSPGYGIHGTWEPNSVGKQSSAGCVRLRNSDVEELFKIVTIGTKVTITD